MKKLCRVCKQEKEDVIAGVCDSCVEVAHIRDDLEWLKGTGRYSQ